MEQRIRFRYIMDQLSGEQLRELMSQLLSDNNNERMIIELLWDRICKTNDDELATKCIEIASNIVQEDDASSTQLKQISLDHDVIGKIGSFLELYDHIQTQKVSRHFFIALRDFGPSIRYLQFRTVIKYAKQCLTANTSFNSNLFKNVKTLGIDWDDAQIIDDNQETMHQIGTNIIKQISHLYVVETYRNIVKLIGICNFNSVKTLHLNTVMLDERWVRILSELRNVQRIVMHQCEYDVTFETKWNTIKDSPILSTVTEFISFYNNVDVCKLFTRKFAPQLKRWHFVQSPWRDRELQHVLSDEEITAFPKLFHFRYTPMSAALADGIDALQTFKLHSLQRITVCIESNEVLLSNEASNNYKLQALFKRKTIKEIKICAFHLKPGRKLFAELVDAMIGLKRDTLRISIPDVLYQDQSVLKQGIIGLIHVMHQYIDEYEVRFKCGFEAAQLENLSDIVDILALGNTVSLRSKNCGLPESDFWVACNHEYY